MDIEIFKLFCSAVEEGSISAAAKKNYLSQPAATKKIRQLEEHYSTLLFERENNTLLLTLPGEKLYQYAKTITQEYNQSIEEMEAIRKGRTQTLKIGSTYTLGEYILPEIMSEFLKLNPNLHINLSIGNTPAVLKDLKEKDIDIAFIEGDIQNLEVNKKVIATDDIILITAPNHEWASLKHIVPRDLLKGRMIRREENSATRQIIESNLAQKIDINQLKNTLELSTTQAIKSAVQSNLGYGFVSRVAVQQELKAGLLSEVDVSGISINRLLWIASSARRFPKESISRFSDFARQFLQKRSY